MAKTVPSEKFGRFFSPTHSRNERLVSQSALDSSLLSIAHYPFTLILHFSKQDLYFAIYRRFSDVLERLLTC